MNPEGKKTDKDIKQKHSGLWGGVCTSAFSKGVKGRF